LKSWDTIISQRDRAVFQKGGYGKKLKLGTKPALLVIDVVIAFIGDKPEPILKSIERFPNSCGEEGWVAVRKIQQLLKVARAFRVPIIYTASAKENASRIGLWAEKHPRLLEVSDSDIVSSKAIPEEIAPKQGDIIIEKTKPSPFFGTPLQSYLIAMHVDTLIFAGCTTSGCVRAGVVDAFSYNYPVAVVEQCTFDRGQASHALSLFDISQKYGEVMSLIDAKKYLQSLSKKKS
jgi:maleamate amidohydrolase